MTCSTTRKTTIASRKVGVDGVISLAEDINMSSRAAWRWTTGKTPRPPQEESRIIKRVSLTKECLYQSEPSKRKMLVTDMEQWSYSSSPVSNSSRNIATCYKDDVGGRGRWLQIRPYLLACCTKMNEVERYIVILPVISQCQRRFKMNLDMTRQPMTTRMPLQKDDPRTMLIHHNGCGRRKMKK